MVEKVCECVVEEVMYCECVIKECEEVCLLKYNVSEKKCFFEEEEVLVVKFKKFDYEFWLYIWILCFKFLGLDRFGNRIWWFDV